MAGRTERQLTNIDTPSEIFKKASDGEKNGVYGDKSKIKLFMIFDRFFFLFWGVVVVWGQ